MTLIKIYQKSCLVILKNNIAGMFVHNAERTLSMVYRYVDDI